MRVYFFPKWLIQAVLIGLCALLAAGVLWSFLGGDDAAVMANPVYQGTNTEKKVALAINVDWGEDILPEMLDTLDKAQVHVTFFGDWPFCREISGAGRADCSCRT